LAGQSDADSFSRWRSGSNDLVEPDHRAGVNIGEGDAEKGAKRLDEEILETRWPDVELLPAGASLTGVRQIAVPDTWLLRDIFSAAAIFDRYELVLIDTGGRTGSLVTLAMYAADVSYAPIAPTTDAVRKAMEARTRVERIQRAHPLKWRGVVLSGFDGRIGIEQAIREKVYEEFGDQVRAEVPRRAVVNEVFQLGDRLGDRTDVTATSLASIFRGFLERDLMGRIVDSVPATGTIRRLTHARGLADAGVSVAGDCRHSACRTVHGV
jgi:cellulose biosynthesis protein BcsQ